MSGLATLTCQWCGARLKVLRGVMVCSACDYLPRVPVVPGKE